MTAKNLPAKILNLDTGLVTTSFIVSLENSLAKVSIQISITKSGSMVSAKKCSSQRGNCKPLKIIPPDKARREEIAN